ncbi:DNA ligase [Streptomyces sp. NPDC007148]|uniref:ATP-dependent DNA ligase n=1 Tax=Streptomyces sp. NPDC007148 TaxID=3364775 RepID=UPI0036AEA35A
MDFPVEVALAQLAPTLPTGPGWWYEIKLDGHRTVMWRTGDGARLQSRSGRDVTANWMDLALAGMGLPHGVVLDGEAVVVVDGRISFEAAQSRAASTPPRARKLAEARPGLFIVWDVLALPGRDMRGRAYVDRRAAMLDVVGGLPSPSRIQAVSASDDPDVARAWYDSLQDTGVEGVVAKRANSRYRTGRKSGWRKIRHAETVDAEVLGYTGPVKRPRALAVRLPDGRTALSQILAAPLASQVAAHLAAAPGFGRGCTHDGETYSLTVPGLVVEVLAGTTRHAVVTVTRLR